MNVDSAGDFELAADCVELGSETGLFLSGNLRVGAVSVRAAFGTAAGAATGFSAGWDSASLFQMLYGNGFESGDTEGWTSSTP